MTSVSPSIQTKTALLAKLARQQRHALAIYFFTGVFPPPPSRLHLQVSSSTISPKTLFVCHQTHHRT